MVSTLGVVCAAFRDWIVPQVPPQVARCSNSWFRESNVSMHMAHVRLRSSGLAVSKCAFTAKICPMSSEFCPMSSESGSFGRVTKMADSWYPSKNSTGMLLTWACLTQRKQAAAGKRQEAGGRRRLKSQCHNYIYNRKSLCREHFTFENARLGWRLGASALAGGDVGRLTRASGALHNAKTLRRAKTLRLCCWGCRAGQRRVAMSAHGEVGRVVLHARNTSPRRHLCRAHATTGTGNGIYDAAAVARPRHGLGASCSNRNRNGHRLTF